VNDEGAVRFGADVLAEVVRLDGAHPVASFTTGPLTGEPAFTRHSFGAGEAHYLATMPDAAGRLAVVRHLTGRAGIEPVVPGLPPRVEAAARGDLITVINHTPDPVDVTLPDRPTPLTLDPYGYHLFRR